MKTPLKVAVKRQGKSFKYPFSRQENVLLSGTVKNEDYDNMSTPAELYKFKLK